MTDLDAADLAIDEDYELRRFNTRQIIERKSYIRPAHEFERHSKFNMPRVKDQIFADEQFAHLMPFAAEFQYAVTLQTRLQPSKNAISMERKIFDASRDFAYFSNRLNYLIFKNAYKRFPKTHRLLIVPVMEGLGFSEHSGKTIHYHVGIGHVPDHISISQLHAMIRTAWCKVSSSRNDIDVRPSDPWWILYSKKEADKGHEMSIDWVNVTMPERSPEF
jgi:hypothetical protein